MKIERYENGSLKSISMGGGIISTMFWLSVLLFVALPVIVVIGAVFGVILLVAWTAEAIHNTWRRVVGALFSVCPGISEGVEPQRCPVSGF